MKIAYLRSNPVSPDSRVEKEVEALVEAGHQIFIFAWDRSSNYKVSKQTFKDYGPEVMIYRVGIKAGFGSGFKKNFLPLLKFQFNIALWLFKNRNNIDVIHSADFDTGFCSALFIKLFRKKFVYDIFDYYIDSFSVPSSLKKIVKSLENFVINSSDLTIICTEERKRQIETSRPQNLIVVHNSPPKINSTPPRTRLFHEPKLVYVGILAGGRMLKELATLAIENQNFQFHIAGFGVLESYFEQLSKKHSNIIYYGKISYEQALELESSADFMTALYDPKIPNHRFAAPNKFYEALMLGKPLIMAKDTGMSRIVESDNIGVLIDYNIESLENGIDLIINNYIGKESISVKMNNIYNEKYSWELMRERLLAGYDAIGMGESK